MTLMSDTIQQAGLILNGGTNDLLDLVKDAGIIGQAGRVPTMQSGIQAVYINHGRRVRACSEWISS